MDYKKLLKSILYYKQSRWWRNYPPGFIAYKRKIPLQTIRVFLKKVFSEQNSNKVGLYIHLPFCSYRCHFCKYYSESIWDKSVMSEYIKSLKKELFSYKIDFKKHFLQSVYIGGGTPTLLNKENWIKLFKIINTFFEIDKNTQILTEGTPETCNYSKLKLLKDLGVNRLSIGVQTFNEEILNSLNRRHSIKNVYSAFKNARRVGIKYLNMDLLFGLPGETKEIFIDTLEHALKVKPECISPAFLDLNKNVFFSKKDVRNVYINKRQAKILTEIKKILKKGDYQNKINDIYYSSFLLHGDVEAYNQNIIPQGSHDSVFAIGCHVDSYLNYLNSKSYQLQYTKGVKLNKYISCLKDNKTLKFLGMEISEDEIIRQYLIYYLIFFKGKINKNDFFGRFNKDIIFVLKTSFSRLLKNSNIKEDKNFVYLCRKESNFYSDRNEFLFFCIKYLYSPKVLKILEKDAKN